MSIKYNYISLECACGFVVQTNKPQVKCSCGRVIDVDISINDQCLKCSTQETDSTNLWDSVHDHFNGQKPSEDELVEYLKTLEIDVNKNEDSDFIDLFMSQFDMEI